jgi:non-lysosomal glucosylceramidase
VDGYLKTRKRLRQELKSPAAVFARGRERIYVGDALEAISLPVGGIGAGLIQMNGRAERSVWQIFNNFSQAVVPNSFFAVRAKAPGVPPVVKALQTTAVGPFPAMKSLIFKGAYPFGWYSFQDRQVPVEISMEVYSPLIPLNAKDSAIPCAIFTFIVENPTDKPIDMSLLATQQNAVGFDGGVPIEDNKFMYYSGNRNAISDTAHGTLLNMTSRQHPGSMALLAMEESASGSTDWTNLEALQAEFSAKGKVSGTEKSRLSPTGETVNGALAVSFKLRPGKTRKVTFVLTWHFPGAKHGIEDWVWEGNQYENWWKNAAAVAKYVAMRFDDLEAQTHTYQQTLYASNLPYWMLDRISSQVAILRTKTCFWSKSGYFGVWEGCGENQGCCLGNCSHVYHYAQAHARLFPEIGRNMRETEIAYQFPDGSLPHRQVRGMEVAADGQFGAILGAYREHLTSPNRRWLDTQWPQIKNLMNGAIAMWDADRDGVLAGAQWNTLDGALGGNTTWIGSLYLAALAACEKMARLQGDKTVAEQWQKLRQAGSCKQDETLFNGEYYIQIPDPEPHKDYATGCAIDQLLGQWWAHQLALGELYPHQHILSALKSLYRYSFHPRMDKHAQAPRKFVADEDAAMQMITWPKGGRPDPDTAIRYADEVMTGFEYPAAALMIQSGLLREGFSVTRAIANRYDGYLRRNLTPGDISCWGYSGNPFGDDECGKFYGRAMSSWSLLTACQGFIYDGPAGVIGFRPVWQPKDHKSFFVAAQGWGLFEQKVRGEKQTERLSIQHGEVQVQALVFAIATKKTPGKVDVKYGGKVWPATLAITGDRVTITFQNPLRLRAGETLEIILRK